MMSYCFRILLVCLSVSVSTAVGEEILDLGAPSLIQIRSVSQMFDGQEVYYDHLTSGSFAAKWYSGSTNWKVHSEPTQPSSISFHDVRLKALQMHLFLYAPIAGFQEFNERAMQRYVETMKQGLRPAEFALLNPGAFRPPVGSVSFLDGAYRVVHLEVVPEDAGQPAYRVSDFLTLLPDGGLFVLRVSGPPELIQRMEPNMPLTLADFVLD